MRVDRGNEGNEDDIHISCLNMWVKAEPFPEIQKTEVKIRNWRREEITKTKNELNHCKQ